VLRELVFDRRGGIRIVGAQRRIAFGTEPSMSGFGGALRSPF
jgi:hypothetical protein